MGGLQAYNALGDAQRKLEDEKIDHKAAVMAFEREKKVAMELAKSELTEYIRVTSSTIVAEFTSTSTVNPTLSAVTARALVALEDKAAAMLDRAWSGDLSDREAAVFNREQKAAKMEADLQAREV
jgi:hypothetical protein